METIKLGSKGELVTILQQRLGLTADGDFGPKTETAVKEFQKKNKLTIDGVVGPKTWECMGVKESDGGESIKIVKSPLSKNITSMSNKVNKYIVLHYTAGASSKKGSVMDVKNVFVKGKSSADFAIDDETILQLNPNLDKYYTWHCGDKKNPYSSGGKLNGKCSNRNSIGIEICSNLAKGTSAAVANHEGWTYTSKALDNAVALVKYLMAKYHIPIDNVVRHYDVTGKLCPGIIGYNDEDIYTTKGVKTKNKSNSDKWLAFKKRLKT